MIGLLLRLIPGIIFVLVLIRISSADVHADQVRDKLMNYDINGYNNLEPEGPSMIAQMIMAGLRLGGSIFAADAVADKIAGYWRSDEISSSTLQEADIDEIRAAAESVGAAVRICDFLVYMEAGPYVDVLREEPYMPHFVLQPSVEAMIGFKNDTSMGFFGLTAIGMAEGIRQINSSGDAIRDLMKDADNPAKFELVQKMATRMTVYRTVSSMMEDSFGIPNDQTIVALALLQSNYSQRFSNKEPTFTAMLGDIVPMYQAWNRGPSDKFVARIEEYQNQYLSRNRMYLDTTSGVGAWFAPKSADTRLLGRDVAAPTVTKISNMDRATGTRGQMGRMTFRQ